MKTDDVYMCLKCGKELQWVGIVGTFLEGIDGQCPDCQIMYRADEPVAVQKGNRIIKIED